MIARRIGDYGVNKKQKKALVRIFLNAVSSANGIRLKNITSNHNIAYDIKDFLALDLETFCKDNGFEYERKGASIIIKTSKAIIRVKCHNSLDRVKKQKQKDMDNGQLILDLQGIGLFDTILELELGYETTKNREKLNSLQMVDFENIVSETLHKLNDKAEEIIEPEEKKTTQANNIRSKENKNNVVRFEAKR